MTDQFKKFIEGFKFEGKTIAQWEQEGNLEQVDFANKEAVAFFHGHIDLEFIANANLLLEIRKSQ